MENIEKSIEETKSYLFGKIKTNPNHAKVWYGTTENIKDYFNQLNWQDVNKVLTVCSSGDHIFNLINKGIKEIDTFDINPLTYYYLNLRMAMMIELSYKNFIEYLADLSFGIKKREYEKFLKIKDSIRKPYDYYWDEIFKENILSKEQSFTEARTVIGKLCTNFIPEQLSRQSNLYYSSEEEYEKAKENLNDCKIDFKCCDIRDIPKNFSSKYDKILLSNISDYLELNSNKEFNDIIVNKLAPLLNDKGEIIAAYIFHYIANKEKRGICFNHIGDYNDSIFEKDYELLEVNNIDENGWIEYGSKDGVLVYKRK